MTFITDEADGGQTHIGFCETFVIIDEGCKLSGMILPEHGDPVAPTAPELREDESLIQETPHYLLLKAGSEYRIRITDPKWLDYRNAGIMVEDL